jgi:hypothetical protein
LAALIGVGVFAFTSNATSGWFRSKKEIAENEWKISEAPERFKIAFPGTPQRRAKSVPPFEMVVHAVEPDRNSAFMVYHTEGALPPEKRTLGAEKLLNDTCDGVVAKGDGGVETERSSISCGAVPGKQLVVDCPKRSCRMIVRCYLTEEHLYVLMAIGNGYTPENPNVVRFFNSFEIIESR